MSNLSKQARDFMRQVLSPFNTRPLGVFKITDPANTGLYNVSITSTEIRISNSTSSYAVNYINKTSKQVATQLNASQFPIKISAIADLSHIKSGELIASGSKIPTSFNILDRSSDGLSCIVRIKRWSLQYKKLTAIGIRPPYLTGANLPWWGRVEAGEFSQSIKGILYKFSVPEYNKQAWSSKYGRPFRDIEGEQANFIGKNKIQLARRPILWKNNIVIAAGNNGKIFSSLLIENVDTINGIIYIKPGSNLPENSTVSYTYLEDTYIYKDINLNGHFLQNPFILDKYILLFARPTESSKGLHRSRGIYHAIGDSLEDAIHSIEESSLDEPVALLGAFNIRSASDVRDIEITDTRSYGGGLTEDEIGRSAEERFPQSQYFLDIGRQEGIPYPGAASIVVDLPSELKEVFTISDLQEKAKKFLAAGVYPIFNYSEDKYNAQFVPITGYNSDISLFNTNIEAAYSGGSTGEYGSITEGSYWWDTDVSIPTPYEQVAASGWDASDISVGAHVNNGELLPYLELEEGRSYYQKYIKGSPDAIFSWEERAYKGQWKRKTFRDIRDVDKDFIVGGQLHIDATLGYKEIRDLKAISPMMKPGEEIWSRFALASSKIIKKINDLSLTSYALVTGDGEDVYKNSYSLKTRIVPGEVAESYEAIVNNYDIMTGLYFWSGDGMLSGVANYAYTSTTQSNTTTGDFPYIWDVSAASYTGEHDAAYDAARDIVLFSRTATHLMNSYAKTAADNTPSLYIPSDYASGPGSIAAMKAQSGAIQIFLAVTSGNVTGSYSDPDSDLISPYFIPASNTQVELTTSLTTGSIYNNDDHLYGRMTKAFAALYATQIVPVTGYFTGSSSVSMEIPFDPKTLALSGIAHRLVEFSRHFTPYKESDALSKTWLNYYNRLSYYAGNVLDDISESIDYLYYGNEEWAGLYRTGEKRAPYFATESNNDNNFLFDEDFCTGQIQRVRLGTTTTKSGYLGEIINGYQVIAENIGAKALVVARKGGITTPGHAKLIKSLGWLPLHGAKGEGFFNGDYARLESIFKETAESYIKSSITNEGRVAQQASYAWEEAPYTGEIPSEIFDVCSDLIELSQMNGDGASEQKYLTIAGGLLAATTGQYEMDGGYPASTIFDITEPVTGNPGYAPLAGYLSVLRRKKYEFSPSDFTSITGSIL